MTRLTRVTGLFNKGAPLYPSHGKAQAVYGNNAQIKAPRRLFTTPLPLYVYLIILYNHKVGPDTAKPKNVNANIMGGCKE